jgi:hypothetical protein
MAGSEVDLQMTTGHVALESGATDDTAGKMGKCIEIGSPSPYQRSVQSSITTLITASVFDQLHHGVVQTLGRTDP